MIDSASDPEREETTARLLSLAGMRPDAPHEPEARVKRAFLDECRAVARARVVRRRLGAVAAVLAAAAAAVVAVRPESPRTMSPGGDTRVASVERLDGRGVRVSRNGSAPIPIRLDDVIMMGDRIETGGSRVGLRLSEGVSVRLDQESQVRLLSATRLELGGGALYVDSGSESPELEVHTAFGVVRDIGTQFEIRIDAASLRVRVRSGVVEVHRGADIQSARPGTELVMGNGTIASRSVAPYGPEWEWTARVGPSFEIEGRPLTAFLEHLCGEQGWTLAYADAALARAASGIILHGSTDGLSPSDALAVVLTTSGLTHRITDGELVITRILP